MITDENESSQSALKTMVEKLDNRKAMHNGYVTKLPELQAILNELTPLLSVAILETHSPVDNPGEISIQVKFGFTLERDQL